MSLALQLSNLATRVGTEFKTIRGSIGPLASLGTTEKSSLVGAINELRAGLEAGGTVTVDAITDTAAFMKTFMKTADAGAARSAIGAGTSNLSIGSTASTAKAGNYQPAWGDVTGKPAVIAAGTDAAAARDVIGAGTSSLAIGVTSSTAKAGDYQPTWGQVSGKPAVMATGTTQAEARTAIGAGTSSLTIGTAATDAKAGNYQPTWAQVTAKPAVIAAGTDQAAARTAIGAQSAADVDTRVSAIIGGAPADLDTLGEIAAKINGNVDEIGAIITGLSNRVRVDAAQALTEPQKVQARSNIDVYSKAEIGNPEVNLVTVFEAALV